jgi:hypothetical protein
MMTSMISKVVSMWETVAVAVATIVGEVSVTTKVMLVDGCCKELATSLGLVTVRKAE